PPPPRSTLFPYTTLFRSIPDKAGRFGGRIRATMRSWQRPREHKRRRGFPHPCSALPVKELGSTGDESCGLAACAFLLPFPSLPLDRKSTRLNSSHDQISY